MPDLTGSRGVHLTFGREFHNAQVEAPVSRVAQRHPSGVIHHSYKGSKYFSIAFGQRCRQAGVIPSKGFAGDAYDNALCESFFASLE